MLDIFTRPEYLVAAAAAISVPIIIHLINRMRFKRLRWAAMEFLLKSQKRNRRRLIIEQLLLLALRCLLVAMVGLLVLRFVGFSFAMFQSKAGLHIVLLDDTLSMRDEWKEEENQKNSYRVAVSEMEKVLKGVNQSGGNERVMLLQLSRAALERGYQPRAYSPQKDVPVLLETLKFTQDQPPGLDLAKGLEAVQEMFPKQDVELVRELISVTRPSMLHVDIGQGVKRAQQIAAENATSRITLHIISDFRHHDWTGPEGEAIQKALLKLTETPDLKIRLVDTAHPYRATGPSGVPLAHDNVGIVDLRPGTRVAGKDMPVAFTVTLANYSAREAQVNVAIFDDATGQEMLQVDFNPPMPLKIPAGSTASVSFELRFNPQIKANETYFAQISARLESAQRGKLDNDGLADDNVRHAAVEVREKVPVLVIDGEGKRGRDENGDSFFIRNAIISVPGASYDVIFGDELGGGLATKALERGDIGQYPSIFILNVREFTPKQKANLQTYIQNGGGGAFFLGPLVSANYYNKELHQGGKGFFPVPLKDTYFPAGGEEELKKEVTGDDHLLLRDDLFPNIDAFPVFGQVFRDPEQRYFLKNLPIRRYFPVPRAQWSPEPGRVDELATLPNEQAIVTYQRVALDMIKGPRTQQILENEEFKDYRKGIERHRKIIESFVGPTSEKKAYQLAKALSDLLTDKGREKQREEFPNLTEFWATSDPKVRSLKEDLTRLIDQVKYGDPFIVRGLHGKGKVVAVMSTAGKEWNDWAGGSDASFIYQPFIWELQNYLSSQGSESSLTVGTPVQIVVDSDQYGKQKNRDFKMLRVYHTPQHGKPAKLVKDAEVQVPADAKGLLTYIFDRSMLPGLYVSQLQFRDEAEGKAPLAAWGHVFNVNTPKEGKLQRVSYDEIDKNLIRATQRPEAIRFEGPFASAEELINRQTDLSESPWFFLIFLLILVAEQALAVHLSFHLRGSEGELPAQLIRSQARAA